MAPSLLAADFARLGEQAAVVAAAGVLASGTAVFETNDLRAAMDGMRGTA